MYVLPLRIYWKWVVWPDASNGDVKDKIEGTACDLVPQILPALEVGRTDGVVRVAIKPPTQGLVLVLP